MNTQQTHEQERPVFVKSTNFRHSKNLKFPNEPPTDRQIIYLKKLGYSGVIPTTRKAASDEITKLAGDVL